MKYIFVLLSLSACAAAPTAPTASNVPYVSCTTDGTQCFSSLVEYSD